MTAGGITGTRPSKSLGRPIGADTVALMDGLEDVIWEMHPMSVRGAFYQVATLGLVEKTEPGYRKVQRVLVKMREGGRIPWGFITDGTRTRYGVQSFGGLDEALGDVASLYRRDLWRNSDEYVEIWLEKEALRGVIQPVTTKWTVSLMVCRGYPSLSYLHEAAEFAQEIGKPLTIYYLGDFDPSGQDIPRMIEDRLEEFGADFELKLLAVKAAQIAEWDLPTRPTKRKDSRSRGFGSVSVELDAVRPDVLRDLVDNAIRHHVDEHELRTLLTYEEEERDLLSRLVNRWEDDVDKLEGER